MTALTLEGKNARKIGIKTLMNNIMFFFEKPDSLEQYLVN